MVARTALDKAPTNNDAHTTTTNCCQMHQIPLIPLTLSFSSTSFSPSPFFLHIMLLLLLLPSHLSWQGTFSPLFPFCSLSQLASSLPLISNPFNLTLFFLLQTSFFLTFLPSYYLYYDTITLVAGFLPTCQSTKTHTYFLSSIYSPNK